jgi:hypothetical protein
MASKERFGTVIRKEFEIIQAGYCLLQNCNENYMTFCLVYVEVQKSLIDKNECDAVTNQILWNVAVLVQGLRFIENGERFSPKDCRVEGKSVNGSNHSLGFTGFGVDDFMSDDKRVTNGLKKIVKRMMQIGFSQMLGEYHG